MRPFVASLLLLACPGFISAKHSAETEIMPLSEIEPGMKGVWKTVLSGTTIESFQLEVLGIARNFVGPQRALIICQALDSRLKSMGPVEGMSGSPVYIENRLVGAYAYGNTWAKEQAIIGVTPIEQMLEVLQDYPLRTETVEVAPKSNGESTWPGRFSEFENGDAWQVSESDGRLRSEEIDLLLRPLPTPLLASGFSERTLKLFQPKFEELGLKILQAPSGSVEDGTKLDLEPGSPVAAVLMSGDFNIAATGTVTYRNGDTLLAFGHPFFQMGEAQLPMAGAEIITVVQTLPSSFKLSNTGPLVGSIFQDRLTAVAGQIGKVPPMLQVSINTKAPNGRVREFSGNLVEHQMLTPIFASAALMQSLFATMESSEEQTFFVDGTVNLEKRSPIEFRNVASGPSGAAELSMGFLEHLTRLYNNPFGVPRVSSIEFSIEFRNEWLISSLKAVQVENRRVKAGGEIGMSLTLYNYQDESTRHRLSIPVPKGLKSGQQLTVLVADAAEAERVNGMRQPLVTSLDEIINQWRGTLSKQAVYVKLLQESAGLSFEGERMFDLPPSVRSLYTSPGNNIARQTLNEVTLWETQIPVEGEFRGSYRIPVKLE